MAGFSVDIVGLKELDAKLSEMKEQTAKRIVWEALEAGGAVIQEAVQEVAPMRPDLPSGTALPVGALAADIEIHRGKDDEGNPAVIVGPGKYTSHAARWVEYGHRQVKGGYSKVLANGKTRGPGTEVSQVPAYPFIRPAYEASRETAVDVTVLTLADGVQKQAVKG
jgi:HK97 gp10 family phage protein